MRKKSLTLVCRLFMSLTTKTLEHVVPAYNLPRGRAVEVAEVAAAAEVAAEALQAAQAAQAPEGSELAHNPVRLMRHGGLRRTSPSCRSNCALDNFHPNRV